MENFNLDFPLIRFSGEGSNIPIWTVRHAVEGVQIFGGIGSGKTSGSGRFLALKYLKAGFGGLVLTVKPDEVAMWLMYCTEAKRLEDLIIVDEEHENYFNFLEYISSAANNTDDIVDVMKTVIRANSDKTAGGNTDSFWENSVDMLMANIIDLSRLAYGFVSVQNLYDIVQSLPKRPEDLSAKNDTAFARAFVLAMARVEPQINAWAQALPKGEREKLQAERRYDQALGDAVPDARTLKYVKQFFTSTYMGLSEKTRSIVDFSFLGFLFRLLRDPVYKLFCQHKCNFSPEDSLKGKIILINLPVKTYHKIGQDAQIMFKYIWQRAMEKDAVETTRRPVFLWADEAQNFLHEHDVECQATARSARIATVYISQNLPNYYANMGGNKFDYRVKSFLGNLSTKFFHANVDVETNRYASELIGDGEFQESSITFPMDGESMPTVNKSLKIDRIIRPEKFPQLLTGSDRNRGIVEAYVHVQGDILSATNNHILIEFNQN